MKSASQRAAVLAFTATASSAAAYNRPQFAAASSAAVVKKNYTVIVSTQRRFQASSSAASAQAAATEEHLTASARNAKLLDRAAQVRRRIAEAWTIPADADPSQSRLQSYREQSAAARKIVDEEGLTSETPREEDVTTAIGEAFDRLLIMQIPLPTAASEDAKNPGTIHEPTEHLQLMLDLAAKHGRAIPVRTIQHMFSRCVDYPEAISLFYAMRNGHISMNAEAYYAMVFSLQRLEEESWGLRYREQLRETSVAPNDSNNKKGGDKSSSSTGGLNISEKVMDFIVHGCENQLLPESKPWVGRVMFNDTDTPAGRRVTEDFDVIGNQWAKRIKTDGVPVRRDV